MEKKILFFGIIFVLLVFFLGCTQKEDMASEETMATGNEVKEVPMVEKEEIIPEEVEVPVYDAPLTGSTDKTCVSDEDCVLVKYKTGVGVLEECMSVNSDYQGIETNDCFCKQVGERTEFFENGSEGVIKLYECRHN